MALTTVLRASSYRRTRWKNGGGETMEIAIAPGGADLDHFDWRISIATVASHGPFSTFPGVDRTLCILDGAGIQLTIEHEPARTLDTVSAPFSFSGDATVASALIDGAVTDFNVMTRRDRFRHTVERVQLRPGERRAWADDTRVIFCETGTVSFETDTANGRLDRCDTLLREPSDTQIWHLRADAAATILRVTLRSASSSAHAT